MSASDLARLLTVEEVAALLQLRPSTVYALCHRGDLPHVRLSQGRKRSLIRFRRSDIERLLGQHATEKP